MPTVHISLLTPLHRHQLPPYFAALNRLPGVDSYLALFESGTLSPSVARACPSWVKIAELPAISPAPSPDLDTSDSDAAPDEDVLPPTPPAVPASLLEFSRILALLLDIVSADSLLIIQIPDVILRSLEWADPVRYGRAVCAMFEAGDGSPSPSCAALRSSSIVHILNACRAYPFRAAELDPPLTLLWRALTARAFPTVLVPYKQPPLPDGSPSVSSTVITPSLLSHSVPFPPSPSSSPSSSAPSSSPSLSALRSVRYLFDCSSSLTSSLPSHLHPSLLIARAIRHLLPLLPPLPPQKTLDSSHLSSYNPPTQQSQ